MSTKKYKIRPCKIRTVLTTFLTSETSIDEQFLSDVICYIKYNCFVFDIPESRNRCHWKIYWILDNDWCYEVKE